MLQRVQLILDKETKNELRRVATQENRSMSDVAREILKGGIGKKKTKGKRGGVEALLKWADKAVKGPGNSEYDKYAYDL